MPVCNLRKLLIAATFLLPLASLPATAAEETLLSIDAIAGLVQVQRDGNQYSLREGDALQAGDVLLTDGRGRATVSLARHGFIELGGNAQVSFDALPHSSYTRDLKTVFNLAKGYLRVVWKRPQSATAWPLYVVMGSTRAVLGSGEYFFQAGPEPRLCAAAGVLAVQTQATPETVRPPACATVKPDLSLAISARNPDDWIAVRRAYSVRAGEPVIVEVASAPAAEAAPAAAPLAAGLPPPKPGMDYSLLEEAGQPGISTSAAASARTTPVVAAPSPVPEAPSLPSAPNRFEVASSPDAAAAPAVIPDFDAPLEAAPAAAAKPAKGIWRINVGSFTEAPDARPLLTQAQSAGLSARAVTVDIRGRNWTRVQVGSYPSNAAAQADAARVKQALGLGSVWFAQDK